MADLFENFTERSRLVLTLAEEEAQGFQHAYIGQEHLLLGLVRVEDGVAARVLISLGVETDKVRKTIGYIVGRGNTPVTSEIGLTPKAKKALELASQQALRLNHFYVGTEHLLLGMLAEGTGIGAGVLSSLGVTMETARTGIIKVIVESEPSEEHTGERRLVPEEESETASPLRGETWFSQWQDREKASKRYSFVLPESLFQEVQDLSDREQTTVVEVMRRFIKLGLLATRIQDMPDASIVIRESGRERELLIL